MTQKLKSNILFPVLLLVITLCVSCGKTGKPTPTKTPAIKSPIASILPSAIASMIPSPSAGISPSASPDVNTTASLVNTASAFEKAIGKDGTWIICLLNDLSIDKDLVLDGEFKNGKKDASGKDVIQRKIALYTQDENKKITNRFTLTVPKLTIKSPKASIQHGTFKGDLYVAVKDFELVDTTVEGNVYFTDNNIKSSFKMDATSKVTGKQEIKK